MKSILGIFASQPSFQPPPCLLILSPVTQSSSLAASSRSFLLVYSIRVRETSLSPPLVPSFCGSQRGAWVLKVSERCKCWCIGHSCFSQKACGALPAPLFPSSWEWFISWPLARKEAGLRSQAFDLREEKGHTEHNCARFRPGATGIEAEAGAPSRVEGGWWERVGI